MSEPTQFPESNTVWAENQPPYVPLPAYVDERETISRWRFGLMERLAVLITGRVWLRQLNFGAPLQPQLVQTENPFSRRDR
jgi:hypothetical protein